MVNFLRRAAALLRRLLSWKGGGFSTPPRRNLRPDLGSSVHVEATITPSSTIASERAPDAGALEILPDFAFMPASGPATMDAGEPARTNIAFESFEPAEKIEISSSRMPDVASDLAPAVRDNAMQGFPEHVAGRDPPAIPEAVTGYVSNVQSEAGDRTDKDDNYALVTFNPSSVGAPAALSGAQNIDRAGSKDIGDSEHSYLDETAAKGLNPPSSGAPDLSTSPSSAFLDSACMLTKAEPAETAGEESPDEAEPAFDTANSGGDGAAPSVGVNDHAVIPTPPDAWVDPSCQSQSELEVAIHDGNEEDYTAEVEFDQQATVLVAHAVKEAAAPAEDEQKIGPGFVSLRKPSVYRPRLSRAHARGTPAVASSGGSEIQNLDVDLQILFGPGDWGMQVWALLRLPAASTDEVAILHAGGGSWLSPLDDRFLEPLALADCAAALEEPLLVTAADLPVRWSRTSRDLHVLGPHTSLAGFVSQARVVIGHENIVLCRNGLVDQVLVQVLATGSAGPVRVEGPGVPLGWTCWRGVRPTRPSAPAGGPEILHALDPLPAVAAELTGGLQLKRGVWLEGHPPTIRLLGLMSEADVVLIDGCAAVRDNDGAWTADGWDSNGVHRIEHGGIAATYTIGGGTSEWEWWPAWQGATQLAGAIASADGGAHFHIGSPAMLLGALPGEICGFAPAASEVGVARPSFEPVWLIIAGTGMRRARASFIGIATAPGVLAGGAAPGVARWARILGASAQAGSSGSAERHLWERYVAAARRRRKRAR